MILGVAVMIRDKYAVRLAPEQREELQNLIRVGKSSARVTARARILLKSNDGWAAPKVAEALMSPDQTWSSTRTTSRWSDSASEARRRT